MIIQIERVPAFSILTLALFVTTEDLNLVDFFIMFFHIFRPFSSIPNASFHCPKRHQPPHRRRPQRTQRCSTLTLATTPIRRDYWSSLKTPSSTSPTSASWWPTCRPTAVTDKFCSTQVNALLSELWLNILVVELIRDIANSGLTNS